MRRIFSRASICLAFTLVGLAASAAVPARIPAPMIGIWAHGPCSVPANRLVITASTLRLGAGRPAPARYDPDDDSGRGAVHWAAEYEVDNFEYVSATKTIVHNSQGFGMPGQIAYKRCPM